MHSELSVEMDTNSVLVNQARIWVKPILADNMPTYRQGILFIATQVAKANKSYQQPMRNFVQAY